MSIDRIETKIIEVDSFDELKEHLDSSIENISMVENFEDLSEVNNVKILDSLSDVIKCFSDDFQFVTDLDGNAMGYDEDLGGYIDMERRVCELIEDGYIDIYRYNDDYYGRKYILVHNL